jgi:hypothetical protein
MSKFEIGQTIGGVEIGTARYRWSRVATEAHTDWRLYCIGKQSIQYEQSIILAGIAEIAALRLLALYTPILATLRSMERKVGALADLRREPWASPRHSVNKSQSATGDHRGYLAKSIQRSMTELVRHHQ